MDKDINGTVSLKDEEMENKIAKMDFKDLKSLFESWDLSKVPEYNIPDYKEDSIMILRAKALIIYHKKQYTEKKS